jgi:RNA polymerase sigma-70 factor, ECF subfamily
MEIVPYQDDDVRSGSHQPPAMAERFILLLEPLKASLMAFCKRSIPLTSDRDDVMQTALTSAFASFPMFQEGSNFRAWIFTHLQNAVWNHCRKQGNRIGTSVAHLDDLPSHDGFATLHREVAYHDLLQWPDSLYDHFDARIATALLALSLNERTALLLRSIGEFSYRDMAAIMHCPMGTVMSHLSRAREKMRERITTAFALPKAPAEPIWRGVEEGGRS